MLLRTILAFFLFISAAFAQNALVVSSATYSVGDSRQITQTTTGALRVDCM